MNGDDDLIDGKISKEESNYRYSSDVKIVCGVCKNYLPGEPGELYSGGGCSVVSGATRYVDTCNYWEPSGAKRPAPPAAGSLPGGLEEARRTFAESYDETIGDSKFPEPRDPWTTSEGEGHAHQHAAAAVEALVTAGWKPAGRSALVWSHSKLPGHEIEIEKSRWYHKVGGLVSHVGEHGKLADHVKSASRIYKIAEANRSFNNVYED